MEWVTREDFLDRLNRKRISNGIRQEVYLIYPADALAEKMPLPPDTTGEPLAYPFHNLEWYCICDNQGFVLTVSSCKQYSHSPHLIEMETHFPNDDSFTEDWKVITKIAPLVSFLDARFGLIESRCHYEKTGTHYAMSTDEESGPYYIYEASSEEEALKACEALRLAQPKADYFVQTKEAFDSSR
ncbi:hypothetical protein Pan241w_42630 [Gimesia alba]|uniref:Uncharacterized protein n=1 Tax=Gimesia alba TaxID=2527973 RepID=A0A517RJV4_9PLAN|nr:hypothetical protein [Gimesia alba]QDT44156.1 hypothetical protein Pan241w_42630 [Gimesia alba]